MGSASSVLAIVMASIAVSAVIIIAWYVLQVVAYWRVFNKAGQAGWKSIIPVYNTYINYKISWRTQWFWCYAVLMLLYFILPDSNTVTYTLAITAVLIACVFSIINCYKLSKAFGHGIGYTIGLIFLHPIFLLILGFGKSRYYGPQ